MSVTGKHVFVTCAGSGLGKAIATAFVKAGATVALCDINEASLQAIVQELSLASSQNVIAVQADIGDESSATMATNQAIERLGTIDALVHCAGIMDRFAGVAQTEQS
jgi:NAD(P)-dependent dehydrogenase (short-subunit alcohol dehydrogenase family)